MNTSDLSLKKYLPYPLVLIPFIVYLSTICPVIYLGDSPEFTAVAFSLGIAHNSGYPLYALIGKLFSFIPIGNIGFRMNLMSTFFAVFTIWLLYSLIFKITSSRLAAFVSSLVLAFVPILWLQAVGSEVYALHSFFVALLIRLLWWWEEKKEFFILVLFVFVTGISFGNHMQTVMMAPAVLFIVLSGEKKALLSVNHFVILTFFFILALSIYIYLPVRTNAGAAIHWGDPNTLGRFFEHVTAKAHRSGYVFNKSTSEYLARTIDTLRFVGFQFGTLLLLAIWGWIKLPSVRWKIFFLGLIFFDFVYTIFLNIISLEITAFTLPSTFAIAALIGIGLSHLIKTGESFPAIAPMIKKLLKTACCIIPCIPLLLNFGLCDQSRNYTAYEHALNIFRTAKSGSAVFLDADNNVFPVTDGRVVEKMREDVTLFDRHNLLFKMPYMDESKGRHLSYYGKWEELRSILEKKIIERMISQGVYFAVTNPYAVSIPDGYTLVPFGILFQVLRGRTAPGIQGKEEIWGSYITESFDGQFERDYMNREVTAYFYYKKGKHIFLSSSRDIGLKYLKLASRVGYDDDKIHLDIALFLTDYGYFGEARSELEKAVIAGGNHGGIQNNWGYYYHKIGCLEHTLDLERKWWKQRILKEQKRNKSKFFSSPQV